MSTFELGNIIDIRKGHKPKIIVDAAIEGSRPCILIDEVRGQKPSFFTVDERGVDVSEQDLCIVWDGANAGTVGFGISGFIGSTVARLRFKNASAWDTPFVGRLLQGQFKAINEAAKGKGATIPHVDKRHLEEILIPAYTLEEQKRIAAILDQADELCRKRQRAIERLNQLGQAIFHEMFGDPDRNDFGWPKVAIKNTDIKIADGNYSSKYPTKDDFVEEGVPFIRANNMRGGAIVDSEMRFISHKKHAELKKGHLKTGDVLITTRGQIGNVSLVPECHESSNINAQIVLLRPTSKKIEASFLFGLLSTKSMQRIFEGLQTGVALKQLPVGKLKDVKIILPPLERQIEFAATNQVLADMKAQAIGSMERANMLFSSLQHRAFRGEL